MIGWILSRPRVTQWLINRATRTPYTHIGGYMFRFWLFNPYHPCKGLRSYRWFRWSIRLHHIRREDLSPDMHSHPWWARTFILRGWYTVEYLDPIWDMEGHYGLQPDRLSKIMLPGDTDTLSPDTFHHITEVSPGGVWTLFITGKYENEWGFMTPKGIVHHDDYTEGR